MGGSGGPRPPYKITEFPSGAVHGVGCDKKISASLGVLLGRRYLGWYLCYCFRVWEGYLEVCLVGLRGVK